MSAPLYCSFCGKSQHAVKTLIAGPSVFICDECVELCRDIVGAARMKETLRPFPGKTVPPQTKTPPVAAEGVAPSTSKTGE